MPGTRPEHRRAVKRYISNLSLSASDKPKDAKPRQGLHAYTGEELRKMNKRQLEQHARKFGVELDRRLNKQQLIKETVKAQAKGIKKKL